MRSSRATASRPNIICNIADHYFRVLEREPRRASRISRAASATRMSDDDDGDDEMVEADGDASDGDERQERAEQRQERSERIATSRAQSASRRPQRATIAATATRERDECEPRRASNGGETHSVRRAAAGDRRRRAGDDGTTAEEEPRRAAPPHPRRRARRRRRRDRAGRLSRLFSAIDRPRAVVCVQRDEGEQAFGDLDLGRAEVAVRDDLDPDAHRRAADPLDLGIDRDQVAQVDRRDELHRLDRDRRDRPLGAARGDDARGDVHLAQHPAAEDVAVGVDVARGRA